MLDKDLPPDPFSEHAPDLSQWAANCRAMHLALVAAGFKERQALEFTIRMMCTMVGDAASGMG